MRRKLSRFVLTTMALVIIFGGIHAVPAQAVTESEFSSLIATLRNTYPTGSQWNGSFDGGIQCYGFAHLLAHSVYSSYAKNWPKSYSLSTVKKGDVVQYGNTSGNGHTIFVTGVSGDTITYVDCNSDYKCTVKWEQKASINRGSIFNLYRFSYLHVSPPLESVAPTINMPEGNYLLESALDSNKVMGVDNDKTSNRDNISLWSKDGSTSQVFRVVKDGSWYRLIVESSGKALDVAGASSVSGTNVQQYQIWDTDAQRWRFEDAGNGYVYIKSALGNYLDVYGGYSASGTNIQTWTLNQSAAQKWKLRLASPTIASGSNYTQGETVNVSWNAIPGSQEYQYYLARYPFGYAYESSDRSGTITGTSISFADLQPGNYKMFVHATNATGMSDQSNWISFVVDYKDYIPQKTAVWNNHLYALYDNKLEWTYANDLCKKIGGHLVTISSQEENDFIQSLTKYGTSGNYWLGYRAKSPYPSNEDFTYHSCTGEDISYTNWASGEPNYSGEHFTKEGFAHIYSDSGKWNDTANVTTASQMGFILEIEMDQVAPAAKSESAEKVFSRFDYPMTWTEAKVFCEAQGGRLAVVENDSDYQAMKNVTENLTEGKSMWFFIGATREKKSDPLQWLGGTLMTDTIDNDLLKSIYQPNVEDNYGMMYGREKTFTSLLNYYKYTDHQKYIGFIMEKRKESEVIPALNNVSGNLTPATLTPPQGGWKAGKNTFYVSCEKACYVAISNDGGQTYQKLPATASDGNYAFTAENVTADTILTVGLLGDVNQDGKISNADITRAKALFAGKIQQPKPLDSVIADVNGSNSLTNADITKLKAAFAGKATLGW